MNSTIGDLSARQVVEGGNHPICGAPHLTSPLVDVLAGHVMSPGDIRRRPAIHPGVAEDRQRGLIRQPLPSLHPRHQTVPHQNLRPILRR